MDALARRPNVFAGVETGPRRIEGPARQAERGGGRSAAFLLLFLLSPAGRLAGEPSTGIAALVVEGAERQVGVTVRYDGGYRRLAYPGGDVPPERGVCTDVVIRAFRNAGIDLQVLVHEDLRRAFAAYPQIWGMRGPDRNIDHRRVPNLRMFFSRHRASLPPSRDPSDYRPGDVVTWRLSNGLPHIGIVSARFAGSRPLVIHNIGAGTVFEDVLFANPVTGRYRYPAESRQPAADSTQGLAADVCVPVGEANSSGVRTF